MKPIVNVVSGFLGAGKTTFILHLVSSIFPTEKIIVIENEFGKVNIDGAILRNNGVSVRELSSGCICCNMLGDLETCIRQVMEEFTPDRIIIEPTGIALLSEIKSTLRALSDVMSLTIGKTVTIVDVRRFQNNMFRSLDFIRNQVSSTDAVFLSKQEGASGEELALVRGQLTEWNKDAIELFLEDDGLRSFFCDSKAHDLENQPDKRRTLHMKRQKLSDETGNIQTLTLEVEAYIDPSTLKLLLDAIGKEKAGTVIRGKGFLQDVAQEWYRFDYVNSDFEFQAYENQGICQLCLIGYELDRVRIEELLRLTSIKRLN